MRQFTDFTVNFDQLNASLMKKSINLFLINLLVLIKIINMNLNSLSFLNEPYVLNFLNHNEYKVKNIQQQKYFNVNKIKYLFPSYMSGS